jgi:hypothetical protein
MIAVHVGIKMIASRRVDRAQNNFGISHKKKSKVDQPIIVPIL